MSHIIQWNLFFFLRDKINLILPYSSGEERVLGSFFSENVILCLFTVNLARLTPRLLHRGNRIQRKHISVQEKGEGIQTGMCSIFFLPTLIIRTWGFARGARSCIFIRTTFLFNTLYIVYTQFLG